MKLKIKLESFDTKKNYYIQNKEKMYKFLTCGKDSYSAGEITITSGINISPKDDLLFVQIGNNTSLGTELGFNIDLGHDFNSVYQGVIREFRTESDDARIAFGQCFKRVERKGEIIIGNDCWIGHNVQIMGGIIVHDGAVIAANSVVTKDVPPYAIVGGNPAKIIKYRFKPEICHGLQRIAWWNWSSEELLEVKDDMQGEVEDFVKDCTTRNFSLTSLYDYLMIPNDYYFVMGDNRDNSSDSRDYRVGLIHKSQIEGTVSIRLYPFNKFGKLK